MKKAIFPMCQLCDAFTIIFILSFGVCQGLNRETSRNGSPFEKIGLNELSSFIYLCCDLMRSILV